MSVDSKGAGRVVSTLSEGLSPLEDPMTTLVSMKTKTDFGERA